MVTAATDKYAELEKRPERLPNTEDKCISICTLITGILGLLFLTGILLILFLSYYPTVRQYHSSTCDVLNCNVTSRMCGTRCNWFNGNCLPRVCLDTVYNLRLVNTNYTAPRSRTVDVATGTPENYFNTTLSCSANNGWTNSSVCYYSDQNILGTLTIYDYSFNYDGFYQIFGMAILGVGMFVCFFFFFALVCFEWKRIGIYFGSVKCPCLRSTEV